MELISTHDPLFFIYFVDNVDSIYLLHIFMHVNGLLNQLTIHDLSQSLAVCMDNKE